MVLSCAAYNCKVRFKRGENIKFHRFPKDTELKKKWISAIRRVNYNPSRTAVICSNHFNESDYSPNAYGNKTLNREAVPSNFDFPKHLLRKTKARIQLESSMIKDDSNETKGAVTGNIVKARPAQNRQEASCSNRSQPKDSNDNLRYTSSKYDRIGNTVVYKRFVNSLFGIFQLLIVFVQWLKVF